MVPELLLSQSGCLAGDPGALASGVGLAALLSGDGDLFFGLPGDVVLSGLSVDEARLGLKGEECRLEEREECLLCEDLFSGVVWRLGEECLLSEGDLS